MGCLIFSAGLCMYVCCHKGAARGPISGAGGRTVCGAPAAARQDLHRCHCWAAGCTHACAGLFFSMCLASQGGRASCWQRRPRCGWLLCLVAPIWACCEKAWNSSTGLSHVVFPRLSPQCSNHLWATPGQSCIPCYCKSLQGNSRGPRYCISTQVRVAKHSRPIAPFPSSTADGCALQSRECAEPLQCSLLKLPATLTLLRWVHPAPSSQFPSPIPYPSRPAPPVTILQGTAMPATFRNLAAWLLLALLATSAAAQTDDAPGEGQAQPGWAVCPALALRLQVDLSLRPDRKRPQAPVGLYRLIYDRHMCLICACSGSCRIDHCWSQHCAGRKRGGRRPWSCHCC